ncbi:hypothetical protein P4O66_000833 [Electrophorus voltai]|uniref:Integrase catalytic domain-containing protein n=1 Tax=Electrophorus voltai TaxID=2609070 RepID=A0AAD9DXD3_9TELE|nr:hypothetical protein P4O66_000833 [Electrophorus voltai]
MVDEHVAHVKRVLQLLLENHLFVKMEKSTFYAQTISFLGLIVSHNVLCMDPAKGWVVENWPRPTSVHLIQRFLGFTNLYRRFMKNFSTVAAPLTALTRKASGWFCWSTEAQQGCPHQEAITVILVVMDRFSKAGCFFAMPKLPSGKETVKLLLTQVVRLHGLPSNIVFDHGPQFASRFWGAFCWLLGAEASLSSGFRPQSNDQTKRVNQDLECPFCSLASSCPSSWSEHLLWYPVALTSMGMFHYASQPRGQCGCSVC